MADYKKMYFTLFNKVTNVIGELEEAQQAVEEMYLNDEAVHLSLLPNRKESSKSVSK